MPHYPIKPFKAEMILWLADSEIGLVAIGLHPLCGHHPVYRLA